MTASFVPPRNSVELSLAKIWAEVLGLDQVGVYDDFFALGGDSVKGVQILSKANAAGFRMTLKQHFQCPTIAALAASLGIDDQVSQNPEPHTTTPAAL